MEESNLVDNLDSARFWSKVEVRSPSECWNWLRGCFTSGYGAFGFRGRTQHANRVAYTLTHGEIPAGLLVRHTCDNKLCCNPDHLVLGTHAENMQDMQERRRASQGDEHWTRHSPKNLAKGEAVKTSKLTADDVRAIREAYTVGRKQVQLAVQFGVSRQLIWQIVNKKWWKHL